VKINEFYLKRCIELAKNGLGTTYPNPLVGAVIVYNNEIIGEGWHKKTGEAHAEVNAINAVKDKSLLAKSTIYVSLEPCSHFGKTPPCSDLIIENRIPNVVIGAVDPNNKVAGEGIERLMAAGINVTVGVLERECNELNKRFFTFHNNKRPYIILKWAESSDGFIAPVAKEKKAPVWLTNSFSRQLVHKWRSEEQAILVGTQTVLDDNPKLDVRNWKGQNPIRIVLDKSNKISKDFNVYDGKSKTIFITEQENLTPIDNGIFENAIFDNLLPNKIVEILYQHGVQSVIIEGGRQTIQTFIDANLWDEARVFKSKTILNEGTKAPKISTKSSEKEVILDDELLTYFNYDYNHNI
jgi:diaminohydroxyphosphoribosylaminopyrimidine deaminase / 5-amino-6-(5-phosphoribosylamino)uracil reductase